MGSRTDKVHYRYRNVKIFIFASRPGAVCSALKLRAVRAKPGAFFQVPPDALQAVFHSKKSRSRFFFIVWPLTEVDLIKIRKTLNSVKLKRWKPKIIQGKNRDLFAAELDTEFYPQDPLTGIPMKGQMNKTARPTTINIMALAGIPYRKNSAVVNCFDS